MASPVDLVCQEKHDEGSTVASGECESLPLGTNTIHGLAVCC